MEKVVINSLVGEVTIIKSRRNRNIRLSVNSQGRVRVSMPTSLPFSKGISFLEQKQEWVLECIKKQQLQSSREKKDGKIAYLPTDTKELESCKKEAKSKLEPRLRELAEKNGFNDSHGRTLVNNVHIKRNISNWGSCSIQNNINLNICLIQLPEHLQDYIILHELCHLRYRNHGMLFHKMLNDLCDGNDRIFSKELHTWRLEYRR